MPKSVKFSRITLSIVLIFVLHVNSNAQLLHPNIPDSVKSFLDTVINIMHKEALNKDSVNWHSIQDEVYSKAYNAKSRADLIPTIQYIFDQLHDNHGSIVYNGIQYGAHFPRPQYSKELMAQVGAFKSAPTLKVKLLDDSYGYILIPSITTSNTDDYSKFAQQIKDSICTIAPGKIKGWIIDLRLNLGGNMYPMLGGIGMIIGDGKAGSFINNKHEVQYTWSVKNGDAYLDTTRYTNTSAKCSISFKNKGIVVLIGPLTQSSGEAIAISIKGRPNSVFIGENTGGYTTANITNVLTGNISLLVASSIEADRKNNVYRYRVAPDIIVEGGDNFIDLPNDKKIESAILWLKNHALN